MYTIPQHEFEQLKDNFDKNDCGIGSQKLSQIINDAIEMAFKPDQFGNNYQQPLVAWDGIEITTPSNYWETPGISLAPEFLESIKLMAKEIEHLKTKMNVLTRMHDSSSHVQHSPKIISTKEQWKEMQPEMDEKERVMVHTTFDKALNVL